MDVISLNIVSENEVDENNEHKTTPINCREFKTVNSPFRSDTNLTYKEYNKSNSFQSRSSMDDSRNQH
jgi:hypothetical protein